MSELKKYAYIRCHECGRDNRLMIDSQKTGHYQCGNCQSHLMFYGTEKQLKYKKWIWAALIGLPVAFIGYQHYPDDNNWTNKRVQTFEKTCGAKMAQSTSWSSIKIENYCQCITKNIAQYKYEDFIKNQTYYLNGSKGICVNGI